MIFSSLTFLFAFLPCVVLAYFIIPNRTYRNVILFLASLGFYAWGEPRYIFLMLFSILSNYVIALIMGNYIEKDNKTAAKFFLMLSVFVNLGLIGFFKYADFFIKNINILPSLNLPYLNIALPIGISFYTFQIMSYVVDVYRGTVKAQKSLLVLGTYVSLFPQLIAGPIVRYETVEKEMTERKETVDDFAYGVRRFLIGLGKKVLISNQVGLIATTIFALEGDGLGLSLAWVGIFAYAFQIYYDFSGYSDMAIGLGRMFGFHFLENFNYPYIADSITDFWRRWHISLSSWFRDYVYIPLGGNRVSKKRWFLNIFVVWFLTGMWHGATWNFILWGLYFGTILVIEKQFLLNFLNKLPKFIRHIYAIILILFGWVIFNAVDLSTIAHYFKGLFGVYGNNSIRAFYNLSIAHLWPFMIAAAVGSTPLVGNLIKKLDESKFGLILDVFLLLILVLCIVFLVNNSFNPFIYFRF